LVSVAPLVRSSEWRSQQVVRDPSVVARGGNRTRCQLGNRRNARSDRFQSSRVWGSSHRITSREPGTPSAAVNVGLSPVETRAAVGIFTVNSRKLVTNCSCGAVREEGASGSTARGRSRWGERIGGDKRCPATRSGHRGTVEGPHNGVKCGHARVGVNAGGRFLAVALTALNELRGRGRGRFGGVSGRAAASGRLRFRHAFVLIFRLGERGGFFAATPSGFWLLAGRA